MHWNDEIYAYLKANHSQIYTEWDNQFENLSILDDDLKDNEIFLTGENHGVASNVQLRMKFLKYFKKKVDFKYYLWEIPYSMAYFLNIYLKSGDTDLLKAAYSPLKGTDAWNMNDFNHWIDLYKFNKSLPQDRRIEIIGIDIEHQPKNALKFMIYTLPNTDIPIEIAKMIKSLKWMEYNIKNLSDAQIKKFSRVLDEDLKRKKHIYRAYLGDNYFGFRLVNRNLLYRYEVYHSNNFDGIRDGKIYKNFMEVNKRIPKGKYYGQLGLSHVFQRPFPYVNWFGAALNGEDSPFKGKVLSLAYVYNDCRYLYPTPRKNYTSSISTLDLKLEAFEKLAGNDCTIFKLNGEDSPFNKKLIWPIVHKLPPDGVTTDYIQYLVAVNNSPAAEPL
ncbi:MAG TPA: erythromycin esterase family protein [Tepidimicrobium sp.]|nr:erythromycin esterase family protein [Tepidimicrobium sp.]